MRLKIFSILILVIGLGLMYNLSPVFGLSFENSNEYLNVTRNQIGYQESQGNVAVVIARVINTALSLVGVVFILLILWGGFSYMTSNAEETKIKKAKDVIIKAIIGLIIIMTAYSITYFVATTIESATQSGTGAPSCPGYCATNCGNCTSLGSAGCSNGQLCCDCSQSGQ